MLLKCEFDTKKLTSRITEPKTANIFYDMFIVDFNDNIVDVPVKITNI